MNSLESIMGMIATESIETGPSTEPMEPEKAWDLVEKFWDENAEFCFNCRNHYNVIGNGRACTVLDDDHYCDCPGVF